MSHFTEEQLKELETIYVLKRVQEVLPVRDGVVTEDTMVWWRCSDGPQLSSAGQHWENIRKYPQFYQLEEPHVKVTYLEE